MTTLNARIELVPQNFNRHTNTIPGKIQGMQVVKSTSLAWVDSGLFSYKRMGFQVVTTYYEYA